MSLPSNPEEQLKKALENADHFITSVFLGREGGHVKEITHSLEAAIAKGKEMARTHGRPAGVYVITARVSDPGTLVTNVNPDGSVGSTTPSSMSKERKAQIMGSTRSTKDRGNK